MRRLEGQTKRWLEAPAQVIQALAPLFSCQHRFLPPPEVATAITPALLAIEGLQERATGRDASKR
jgi:hypothetical protein